MLTGCWPAARRCVFMCVHIALFTIHHVYINRLTDFFRTEYYVIFNYQTAFFLCYLFLELYYLYATVHEASSCCNYSYFEYLSY